MSLLSRYILFNFTILIVQCIYPVFPHCSLSLSRGIYVILNVFYFCLIFLSLARQVWRHYFPAVDAYRVHRWLCGQTHTGTGKERTDSTVHSSHSLTHLWSLSVIHLTSLIHIHSPVHTLTPGAVSPQNDTGVHGLTTGKVSTHTHSHARTHSFTHSHPSTLTPHSSAHSHTHITHTHSQYHVLPSTSTHSLNTYTLTYTHHSHTHIHTHTHTHTHTHIHTRTHTHSHTLTHIHTLTHTCTLLQTRTLTPLISQETHLIGIIIHDLWSLFVILYLSSKASNTQCTCTPPPTSSYGIMTLLLSLRGYCLIARCPMLPFLCWVTRSTVQEQSQRRTSEWY